MTLQEVLDALKHNADGKLFRKDRTVRFYVPGEHLVDPGPAYNILAIGIDDEGEICVDLALATEEENEVPTS